MQPGSTNPAQAGIRQAAQGKPVHLVSEAQPSGIAGTARDMGPTILVLDAAWRRLVPNAEALASRAARAAGGAGTVVLSSDREVKRLNSRHRRRNKPTNVLTFEPAGMGGFLGGDIVLAAGTVRREALAFGRSMANHLSHLVVHGALHLRGHDHHHPGEARRMEMEEARILRGIGVPNPWKRR